MNKATLLAGNFPAEEKLKKIFKCEYAYFIKSEKEYKSLLKKLSKNSEIITFLKSPRFAFNDLRDFIKETKRQGKKIAVVYKSFSPFQIYPFEWIGDYALFPLRGFVSGEEKTRGFVFLSKQGKFSGFEREFPEMPYLETVEARRRMAEQTTLFLIRKIDGLKSIFKEIYYPYLTDKKNAKSFLKSPGNTFAVRFENGEVAEKFMDNLKLFEKKSFVFGKNRSCVKKIRNYLVFSIGLESVSDLESDIREAKKQTQ